jgi:hypothetical protein
MSDVKPTPLVRSGRNLDSGPVTLLTGMGERSRSLQPAKPALPARKAEPAGIPQRQTVPAALPGITTTITTSIAVVSRKQYVWPLLWACILACALASGWLGFKNRPPSPLAEHEIPPRIQAAQLTTPYTELPADPHAALTTGMDRLNAAVAARHAHSQEEMLTMASRSGPGCTLVFTNHLPSVVFGMGPVRQNSLARTLSDCADAVSKAH